jgi:hypothetical protein
MKKRIESVRIEQVVDEMPDTSYLGKYTDKKEEWAICRHCGEFVTVAEEGNRRQDEINDEIYDIENGEETEEVTAQIEALNKELDGLSLHECPHWSREYNYFVPYAGGEEPGTDDYKKYGLRDYARMEALSRGEWYFMGIIAKAKIITESGTVQTVRSGGLWGIESDSGDYIKEVEEEELASLRIELESFGFGKRAIDYAIKNAVRE